MLLHACVSMFAFMFMFVCTCLKQTPTGEDNKELWKAHDATELVKSYSGPPLPTLIDTGSADTFLQREVSKRAGLLCAAGC